MPYKSGPPFRRTKIVNNPPESCEKCKKIDKKTGKKQCEITLKPCAEVERWINQDRSSNSVGQLLMGNKAASFGDSFDFVDIMALEHEAVVKPDRKSELKARALIDSLNLNPVVLEFIQLYYYDGKRLCEVAAELGITDQAAHSRHIQTKREISTKLNRRRIWFEMRNQKWPSNQWREIARLYYGKFYSSPQVGEAMSLTPRYIYKVLNKIRKLFNVK